MTETLPIKLGQAYANITGDSKLKKQMKLLSSLSDKMFSMQFIFHHFIGNTWNFENKVTDFAWSRMSDEERAEFKLDVTLIDWDSCFRNHIYGLRYYYLGEDIVNPSDYSQLFQKLNVDWFHDIRVARAATATLEPRSTKSYFKSIASQNNFNAYVKFLTRDSPLAKNEAGAKSV